MPQTDCNEQIELAVAAAGRLGRRDFLKLTALGIGMAATGIFSAGANAEVPAGIRFIEEDQFRVFNRLMQVSLPVKGTKLASLDDIPVMKTLDAALLAGMRPHELLGLKIGVKVFEEGPLKTYGKPFSELDDADAAAFCDAWGNSEQAMERGLATVLKKLLALSYWANPPTWAALGYDGPVSKKWGLQALGNAPLPLN